MGTDDLEAILADARARLVDAPREGLGGALAPSRLKAALGVQPRILRAADVWNLGVLLLGGDALYATGDVLRAAEEVRLGYTAESQRERAAI
ncbi:MAG: glutaminase, partial [Microbacterium sp.]